MTHTSSELKAFGAALVEFDVNGDYSVDVTVVIVNDATNSTYNHSTYLVKLVTDSCPDDPEKIAPGEECGCGVADTDNNSDGVLNCNNECPGAIL